MEDFLPYYRPDLTEREMSAVQEALETGWISTGPKVSEFEALLKTKLQAEAALAVNACTSALHLGLNALGVGPGVEVITTPLTYCATANAIEIAGGTIKLVDAELESWQIDLDKVSEKVTDKTKALIPVHFAGHLVDKPKLNNIAKKHNLGVLEDAAHVFPTKEYTGEVTNLMAFSFYANKNITCAEGGLLAGPADLVEKARAQHSQGMNKDAWKRYDKQGSWRYDIETLGYKYNMTDIQATMGLVQMGRMAEFEKKRQVLAEAYYQRLSEVDHFQPLKIVRKSSYHLFPITIDFSKYKISRDEMIEELKKRGVGTSMHYIPLYSFTFYQKKYGWNPQDFPNCEKITQNNFTLPFYTRMTEADVDKVVDTIKQILGENK